MAITIKRVFGFELQGLRECAAVGGTPENIADAPSGMIGTRSLKLAVSAGEYAHLDHTEYQHSVNTNAKAIGFWIKCVTYGVGSSTTVCDGYDDGDNRIFRLYYNSDGTIDVQDSNLSSSGATGLQVSGIDPTDGGWHFIEFWFQQTGNDGWALHVDGQEAGSGTGLDFLANNGFQYMRALGPTTTSVYHWFAAYIAEADSAADLLGSLDVFPCTGSTSATTGGDTLDAGTWQNTQEIPPSDTNIASYNYSAGSPTTQDMPPTALLTQTGLTGTVGDIDEDPDSPDGNWLTTNASNSVLRCSFDTPTATPDGTQTFRVWCRKNATGGGDPTLDIHLYLNGVDQGVLVADTTITSTTGQMVTATFDAATYSIGTGVNVELYCDGTKGGGGPNERNVEIGAVEWQAQGVGLSPAESGWVQADTGSLAGPSGVSGIGTIVGLLTYIRTAYSGSGSVLTHSLERGNSGDGVTSLSLGNATVSYADYFDFTESATIVPTDTEYARSGFGHPAGTEVDIDCAEVITMVAHVPVANLDRSGTVDQTFPSITQAVTVQADFTTAQVLQTLSAVTQAATGTHLKTYTATANQTLPALTQAVTATHLKTYSVTVVQTVSAITQIASGTFVPWSASGTIAQLLPTVMQSATGATSPPVFAATTDQALPALTQTLSGTVAVPVTDVTISQTLQPVTQLATGTHLKTYTATAAQTLAAVTQVVTGTHLKTYDAVVAQTLSALTQAATGTHLKTHDATVAQTLGAITQAATGTHLKTYDVAVAQTLPALAQIVAGTHVAPIFAATADQTLPALSQSLTGTASAPVTDATVSQALPALTQSVTGTHLKTYDAAVAQTLPALAQVVTGTHLKTYDAAVAQTLPAATQALTATFTPVGARLLTVAQTFPAITQAVTATFAPGASTGTVAQTLAPLLQAVTGTHLKTYTATTTQTLGAVSQTATGTFNTVAPRLATVAQTLPAVTQDVTATFAAGISTGSITQTLPAVSQVAAATFNKTYQGTVSQSLSAITQAITADFVPVGAKTATITQTLASLTQSATGTFAPGTSAGTVAQLLPTVSQAATATHLKVYTGVVTQTLPALSQTLTATYQPKPVSATVAQTLSPPSQSVSATFAAGASTGVITQTLPLIALQVTGTFSAGASTGSILQTLPVLTQVVTVDYQPQGHPVVIAQILPAISQVLTGTWREYEAVPSQQFIWVVPGTPSRIYIRDSKITLYR